MQPVALITGASRGLGLALAGALAEDGWTLILDARGAEALEAARAALAARTTVVAIPGDVTDPQHRALLADAARQAGGLDLLVNNASILGPSPQPALLDYPLDVLERSIAPMWSRRWPSCRRSGRCSDPARASSISPATRRLSPMRAGAATDRARRRSNSSPVILAAENPTLRVYWVDPGDMRTQMHQEAFPGEDISDRPLPETSVPGLLALIAGGYPSGRYAARALTASRRGGRIVNEPDQRKERCDDCQ